MARALLCNTTRAASQQVVAEPKPTTSPIPHLGFRSFASFEAAYTISEGQQPLGRGNFGVVHLAHARTNGRSVAVKVLPKLREDRAQQEYLACIQQEVRCWC
jgi:hypothetical protein